MSKKNFFRCILYCKAHKGCLKTEIFCKYSIKPALVLFILSRFGGGGGSLIETKALFEKAGGCFFNFEKTIVSVLHEVLEYKVDKLKYKKVGALEVMQP